MNKSDLKRLDAVMDKEDWKSAREILRQALREEPDSHWLMTRMSTAYYEDRDYSHALNWSAKAMKLAPRCPLVQWDHAGDLEMNGREVEAIRIWTKLVEQGPERLAEEECSEGQRWSESLVNDCRYRAARACFDIGRHRDALRLIRDHLKHRRPGLPSLYSKAEALAAERRIRAAMNGAAPLKARSA